MKSIGTHETAAGTMTTTEAASSLGVSVATLHNWKHSGKFIPAGVCSRGYNIYTAGQVAQFKDTQAQVFGAAVEDPTMGAAAAARALGVPVTRLRSLDRTGRFVPAGRSASNRRMYTTEQVEALREYLAAGGMPPRIAELTITRHEAARLLGVSIRTLQLWEQEKKLVPLARWEIRSLYTKGQIGAFLAATTKNGRGYAGRTR
jgi:DNA-binding transcriptional MerR regulator